MSAIANIPKLQSLDPLLEINTIITTGSVSGTLDTAGFLKVLEESGGDTENEVQTIFTQANAVDKDVDQNRISEWPKNSQVMLINLAVNNDTREEVPEKKTTDLVKRIFANGHVIRCIVDEHGREAWEGVMRETGKSLKDLDIQPYSLKPNGSSSDIFLKSIGHLVSRKVRGIWKDASKADQMDFSTYYGRIANEAIKSDIRDNRRRELVARNFAKTHMPRLDVRIYMEQYSQINRNIDETLNSRRDLGQGISEYQIPKDKKIDATAFFNEAYEISPVVVLRDVSLGPNKGVSIATNLPGLDVLGAIQRAGIGACGMIAKANIVYKNDGEDDQRIKDAIEAVRRVKNSPRFRVTQQVRQLCTRRNMTNLAIAVSGFALAILPRFTFSQN